MCEYKRGLSMNRTEKARPHPDPLPQEREELRAHQRHAYPAADGLALDFFY